MNVRLSALVRAVLFVALALVVCRTSGFESFTPYRTKLVEQQQPLSGGVLQVPFAAPAPPLALILRAASPQPGVLRVIADGAEVCAPMVDAGARRVDCAITRLAPGEWHTLTLEGPEPAVLSYLEVATHHGNVTAPNVMFIVPASVEPLAPSWLWTIGFVAAVALALLVSPWAPRSKPVRIAMRALQAMVAALVLTVLVLPWLTPYRIVISEGTMVRWLILGMLPSTVALAAWVLRSDVNASLAARLVRVSVVGVGVMVTVGSLTRAELADFDGNYSGFLKIARAQFEHNPLVNTDDTLRQSLRFYETGYDGEFMYMMTFDPLLRRLPNAFDYGWVVDEPPYRYGRIGHTWLAKIASFNQWQHYPTALVWIVWLAVGGAAAAVAWLAGASGRSPALGLLVLLIPGFWTSVQTSLPEPLAAATLLLGVACIYAGQFAVGGLLLALSLMVRETGLLAVLAVCAGLLWQGRWRQTFLVGACAIAPIAIWRVYVAWVLWPAWGWEGIFYNPPTSLPLGGILYTWRTIAAGHYWPGVPHMATSAIAFPFVLIAGAAVVAITASVRPGALPFAACLYALSALSLSGPRVWVHVINAERTSYELFVLVLLMTTAAWQRTRVERAAIAGFWCLCAVYMYWFAFDAVLIREAVSRFLFDS